MVGANAIFMLQDFQVTLLGKPADSALAIVAGLLGAVIGSTYPVASILISAFAGALVAGTAMAVCVATMPDNEFGVSINSKYAICNNKEIHTTIKTHTFLYILCSIAKFMSLSRVALSFARC